MISGDCCFSPGIQYNICDKRVYLSMVLQPFVGPWPFFQFLDSVHSL
jgi:hypothetical protein